MRVAVVGATGMVGEIMLKVLKERNFPVTELILVASEKSVGKEVEWNGKTYKVVGLQTAVDMKPEIALFSAGGETSLIWAPKFAEVGTTVIDNSSAWRMDATKKLVVPEINATSLTKEDKIIANPNCSTIQMVDGNIIVEENKKEAFKLYEKASKNGSIESKIRLADFYIEGVICEKNIDLAIGLYSSCIELGFGMAAHNLATVYRDLGNYSKAFQLYKTSQNLDKTNSIELAYCYYFGIGER